MRIKQMTDRFFIAAILGIGLVSCAQAIPPPQESPVIYDQTVPDPWHPPTTLHHCHTIARTLYAQGHVFVINEVQCVDDRGRAFIIN